MEENKLDVIRGSLEEEREAIEKQLAEYGAVADREGIEVRVDGGFADSAQATAERSEILSFIEQLQSSHSEIAAALDRIEEGRYGRCERCGEHIPIERLEAIPTARLCVNCKQVRTG
jgi:DnaK suppressor protein